MKFNELGLSKELETAIQKQGFKEPTLIQDKSIPSILEKKDVIGDSATGSGKTLAFGCGVIERTIPKAGLQALILTPTRELAEQVKNALKKYTSKLNILAIYGGVSINPQIHNLQKAEVVVATPGRLLDHMQRNTIKLNNIKLLVLDEVDKMLDMGFIDDVKKIIDNCPKKRQTLFFSATISYKMNNLAKNFTNNAISISGKKMVDPNKLKQVYYDVNKKIKLSLLVHLLKNESSGLVMVFCNTRKNVDFVAKVLKVNNINSTAIHGGLTQNKRERTITRFHKGKAHVLVCTDVAARGLHINDVSHIYNYDLPKNPKDYIHRIGRTARAGEKGKVINILCDYEHDSFSRILYEYRDFAVKKVKMPYVNRVKMPKRRKRW